ncbi:MAG: hypothetical protein ACFFCS_17050 [Candidatus Hodarchaeota archaeon]
MADLPEEKDILNALNHQIRREILVLLESGPMSYTKLLDHFQIASGKLNYHIKLLNGLVQKDTGGNYITTAAGEKALKILGFLQNEVEPVEAENADGTADQKLDDQAQKILDILQAKVASRRYAGYYGSSKTRTKATVLGLVVAMLAGIMVLFISMGEDEATSSSSGTGSFPWIIFSVMIGLISTIVVIIKIRTMRRNQI